ncbi:DUF2807 domain-containing protein [Parasalinivibrio latis]|uniref:GIN domain-containing protein n=1 Tax=Parasalinivibrio latis TaxID=2952610 RepID=UPI0030DEA26C
MTTRYRTTRSTFKTLVALLFLFIGLGLAAAHAFIEREQLFYTDSFTSLKISRGINAKLICGEKPAVIAYGSSSAISSLFIDSNDGILSIESQEDMSWFSVDDVSLTVVTNQPVSAINVSQGVSFVSDACALSKEKLTVNGSMGAVIELAGGTNQLDAELSMGASMNEQNRFFAVKTATVKTYMGAEAYLCNTGQATGKQVAGSMIYVGKQTVTQLESGIGASLSTEECQ